MTYNHAPELPSVTKYDPLWYHHFGQNFSIAASSPISHIHLLPPACPKRPSQKHQSHGLLIHLGETEATILASPKWRSTDSPHKCTAVNNLESKSNRRVYIPQDAIQLPAPLVSCGLARQDEAFGTDSGASQVWKGVDDTSLFHKSLKAIQSGKGASVDINPGAPHDTEKGRSRHSENLFNKDEDPSTVKQVVCTLYNILPSASFSKHISDKSRVICYLPAAISRRMRKGAHFWEGWRKPRIP